MFVTPAFAQSAGSPGMGDFMGMILPLVMIMAVFVVMVVIAVSLIRTDLG